MPLELPGAGDEYREGPSAQYESNLDALGLSSDLIECLTVGRRIGRDELWNMSYSSPRFIY